MGFLESGFEVVHFGTLEDLGNLKLRISGRVTVDKRN